MKFKNDSLQEYMEIDKDTTNLLALFQSKGLDRIFLVCGKSFDRTVAHRIFSDGNFYEINRFSDFLPNPKYESVQSAIKEFNKRKYDAIVAVGGGSAIDVAKCIKKETGSFLVAIPTTAGSGAEATHFAVIYKDGKKVSVEDEKYRPDVAVLWPQLLKTLPEYQRKSTMLDALCHAMESAWSVNSTDESLKYSCEALRGIAQYKDGYLKNADEGNKGMLRAANLAGQAIDIAKTTAAHAMSYGLTTEFGIAHGHAAALCLNVVLPFVAENTFKCTDNRGQEYLEKTLYSIAKAFGYKDKSSLCREFYSLLKELHLEHPKFDDETIDLLVEGVNIERLNNIPVEITKEDLNKLYRKIQEER